MIGFFLPNKGLITVYGGLNSHMAIRAVEHRLPFLSGLDKLGSMKCLLSKVKYLLISRSLNMFNKNGYCHDVVDTFEDIGETRDCQINACLNFFRNVI